MVCGSHQYQHLMTIYKSVQQLRDSFKGLLNKRRSYCERKTILQTDMLQFSEYQCPMDFYWLHSKQKFSKIASNCQLLMKTDKICQFSNLIMAFYKGNSICSVQCYCTCNKTNLFDSVYWRERWNSISVINFNIYTTIILLLFDRSPS